MPVQLNHTIVAASDPAAAAARVARLLGLGPPQRFGPFTVVQTDNGVSLDFAHSDEPVAPQHYAFLVSEAEFDGIYDRIRADGLDHWADPMQRRPGEINHHHGGRGVYFLGPDGHYLEALTQPYGNTA